jgi:hypothetical protein
MPARRNNLSDDNGQAVYQRQLHKPHMGLLCLGQLRKLQPAEYIFVIDLEVVLSWKLATACMYVFDVQTAGHLQHMILLLQMQHS